LHGPSFIWQPAKIFSSSAKTQNQALKDIKGNLTSSLAQNLAGQLLQDPKFLEKQEGWDALSQATKDTDPVKMFPVPTVADSDITISQDASQEGINQYTNKIADLFNQHNQKMAGDFDKSDIELIQQALDNNDFKPLDKLIKLNQDMLDDLKKIPVPQTWLEIHKEQIGLFILYGDMLKIVQNTEQDPLKSMIALERFQQLPDLMTQLGEKITALLGHEIDFENLPATAQSTP